jgi:uncharacterized protein involved in exopolysaccharide biosynthesis
MSSPEYTSLTQIANALLRRRWRIVRACGWTFVVVLALATVLGREYGTEVQFVPDAGSGTMGALAGLAAQFGLSGALANSGPSPDFYVSLATSRTILGAVADTSFTFRHVRRFLWWRDTTEVSGTIAELYKIDRPDDRARERDDAIETLGDLVRASSSLETGIVTIRATTDWPELSFAITTMIAGRLGQFSLEKMQTRAREERRFVEAQLAAQRVELAGEEEELRRFLERNRQIAGSPQLTIEHERLERDIAMQQQVVMGLAQGFEQSRIEEVRNTPVLTIVEAPEIPATPEKRHLLLKLIAAMAVVAAAMSALAVLEERAEYGALTIAEEGESFAMLRKETLQDLRRWNPFAKRSRAAG